ncbi:flagellar basal-body rod protein FlgF [Undibacterium sp. Ji50W]|uniref:flagellar basal-body rod protein FlgF n=1 Tax=Undibacterium sp. Ji50W TaxID=3413041 RepID=UPI003BF2FECE
MLNSIKIATTGLTGFSKELQTISNNVANLNTPGFKGSNAKFSSFFSHDGDSASGGHQGAASGAGLAVLPSVVNFAQGQINQTGNDLDVAVDGNGFFVLRDSQGQTFYTRDGSFKFDSKGFLVDADGNHVQALTNQGVLQDISITGLKTNAASATKAIQLSGRLSTADTDKAVGGVIVTDAVGGTHTLAVNFKNNNAATPGSWLVTIKDGNDTVGTGEVKFISGVLDSAHNSVAFTYSPSGVAPLSLTMTLDASTTSAATGASTLAVASIDGFAQGDMSNASFDGQGNLVISYTNGQTSKNQTLALANFSSTDHLVAISGNKFKSTRQQDVSLGVASSNLSTIDGGSLEGSNVDLSKEFSEIIITQRGYQASSELISTANQMLDTLLHMKG